MEINITTSATARAVETSSAASVLPDHIQYDSAELMKLITAYYDHINTEGLPTYEVNNLNRNHDVDLASEKYLDAIERQIAVNIPQTQVLDRRRLYKLITDYYLTRGSDDSILTFFRLFYNEVVTLLFPKDFLLDSSGLNGIPSDTFKIRDSYYWQEFSYVINSGSDQARWRNEFLKFVHPAGLKLFVALTITGVALNDWLDEPPEYLLDNDSPGAEECDWWSIINWDKFYGQHAPKIQPCTYIAYEFILKALMGDGGHHYLTHVRSIYSEDTQSLSNTNLLSSFFRLLTISYHLFNRVNQIELFHDEYILSGYRRDPSGFLEGYADHTIAGTFETSTTPGVYSPTSVTQFSGYSHKNVKDAFGFSYENVIESSDLDSENIWSDDDSSPSGYAPNPDNTSKISVLEQHDFHGEQIVITNPEGDSDTHKIKIVSNFEISAVEPVASTKVIYLTGFDGGTQILRSDNEFKINSTMSFEFSYPAATPTNSFRLEDFPELGNFISRTIQVSYKEDNASSVITLGDHVFERGFFGEVAIVERDAINSYPDDYIDSDKVINLPLVKLEVDNNLGDYNMTITNDRSDYTTISDFENSVIAQQNQEQLRRLFPTV